MCSNRPPPLPRFVLLLLLLLLSSRQYLPLLEPLFRKMHDGNFENVHELLAESGRVDQSKKRELGYLIGINGTYLFNFTSASTKKVKQRLRFTRLAVPNSRRASPARHGVGSFPLPSKRRTLTR